MEKGRGQGLNIPTHTHTPYTIHHSPHTHWHLQLGRPAKRGSLRSRVTHHPPPPSAPFSVSVCVVGRSTRSCSNRLPCGPLCGTVPTKITKLIIIILIITITIISIPSNSLTAHFYSLCCHFSFLRFLLGRARYPRSILTLITPSLPRLSRLHYIFSPPFSPRMQAQGGGTCCAAVGTPR